jgi:hypothetical protein
MPYSEAVRPTRLKLLLEPKENVSKKNSHNAISPRFAISTEVSGLIDDAAVELFRTREAALIVTS